MKTNIGEMPLEDYLEIVALQHGFDSYEDLRYNGFVVDIQEEIAKNKTPSPKHECFKNSAFNAPPGARTLDTLIKSFGA